MRLPDIEKTLAEPVTLPAPFVAEYPLEAGGRLPADLDIKRYPGLLFYYLCRGEAGINYVAAFWSSRESFALHGETFGRAIGAGAHGVAGYVTDLTSPDKPLWKRVSWYTLVVSIAALLGAVHAIGTYFDWLFTAPHLALKSDKTRVHLIEGTEFLHAQTLSNHVPVAHRDVVLSAALEPATGATIPLTVNPATIPHLAPNAAQEVTVRSNAPVPGEYQLAITATADAGVFRPGKTMHFRQPVTVWSRNPSGRLSVKSVRDETALLSGAVAVGAAAPNGLECEIELKGVPKLEYVVLEFPRLYTAPEWATNDAPGSEVASLRWAALAVQQYETLRFQLALRSASKVDWTKLAREAGVRCFYRKEKLRESS